jgi:hypothetical protein
MSQARLRTGFKASTRSPRRIMPTIVMGSGSGKVRYPRLDEPDVLTMAGPQKPHAKQPTVSIRRVRLAPREDYIR